MQGTIVEQGVELMLYGMGTVAMFLAVLVVATTLMSRIVVRYFPEPQSSASTAIQKLRARTHPADDPNLVAEISAAIHRHRTGRK